MRDSFSLCETKARLFAIIRRVREGHRIVVTVPGATRRTWHSGAASADSGTMDQTTTRLSAALSDRYRIERELDSGDMARPPKP